MILLSELLYLTEPLRCELRNYPLHYLRTILCPYELEVLNVLIEHCTENIVD